MMHNWHPLHLSVSTTMAPFIFAIISSLMLEVCICLKELHLLKQEFGVQRYAKKPKTPNFRLIFLRTRLCLLIYLKNLFYLQMRTTIGHSRRNCDIRHCNLTRKDGHLLVFRTDIVTYDKIVVRDTSLAFL